jgi:hypothetical protein
VNVKELELFLESCRSESTKEQYAYLIKRRFDFAGIPAPTDPQDIQNEDNRLYPRNEKTG